MIKPQDVVIDWYRFRIENNITLRQASALLNYSHTYIAQIENGERPATGKFLGNALIAIDKFTAAKKNTCKMMG